MAGQNVRNSTKQILDRNVGNGINTLLNGGGSFNWASHGETRMAGVECRKKQVVIW